MKYRRKATEVEAVQLVADELGDLVELLMRSKGKWTLDADEQSVPELTVGTVDGNDVAVPFGAYVVLDSKGYVYPCDAEIFESNHEEEPARMVAAR